jgi:hypothetical protein
MSSKRLYPSRASMIDRIVIIKVRISDAGIFFDSDVDGPVFPLTIIE